MSDWTQLAKLKAAITVQYRLHEQNRVTVCPMCIEQWRGVPSDLSLQALVSSAISPSTKDVPTASRYAHLCMFHSFNSSASADHC